MEWPLAALPSEGLPPPLDSWVPETASSPAALLSVFPFSPHHIAATLCSGSSLPGTPPRNPLLAESVQTPCRAVYEPRIIACSSSWGCLSHALPVGACCFSSHVMTLLKLGVSSCKLLPPWNLLCPAPHPPPRDSPSEHIPPPWWSFSPTGGKGGNRWSESQLYHESICVTLAQLLSLPEPQFLYLPRDMAISIPHGTGVRVRKWVLAQGLPHNRCSLSLSHIPPLVEVTVWYTLSPLLEHRSPSPCYLPKAPNKVLAQSRFSRSLPEKCHIPVACPLSLSLTLALTLFLGWKTFFSETKWFKHMAFKDCVQQIYLWVIQPIERQPSQRTPEMFQICFQNSLSTQVSGTCPY